MSKKRDVGLEAIEHQDNLAAWYKTLTQEEQDELWKPHYADFPDEHKDEQAIGTGSILALGIVIVAALLMLPGLGQ